MSYGARHCNAQSAVLRNAVMTRILALTMPPSRFSRRNAAVRRRAL
jgi:hypothetical protein